MAGNYVNSANCTFVQGSGLQLAQAIQALITATKTIQHVVKLRESGVYLIIHTA